MLNELQWRKYQFDIRIKVIRYDYILIKLDQENLNLLYKTIVKYIQKFIFWFYSWFLQTNEMC